MSSVITKYPTYLCLIIHLYNLISLLFFVFNLLRCCTFPTCMYTVHWCCTYFCFLNKVTKIWKLPNYKLTKLFRWIFFSKTFTLYFYWKCWICTCMYRRKGLLGNFFSFFSAHFEMDATENIRYELNPFRHPPTVFMYVDRRFNVQ